MRLIDADALKREMWRRCGETDIEIDKGRAKWDSGLWIRYKVFEECIEAAPTIESKHGRWITVSDGYGNGVATASICECSLCKDTIWVYKNDKRKWNYCPNCGAKMDEVEE